MPHLQQAEEGVTALRGPGEGTGQGGADGGVGVAGEGQQVGEVRREAAAVASLAERLGRRAADGDVSVACAAGRGEGELEEGASKCSGTTRRYYSRGSAYSMGAMSVEGVP